MTKRLSVLLAIVSLATTALLAPTAQAQQAGITGDVPAEGGVALVQWGGGSVDALHAAAAEQGCDLTSTWITSDGAFIGYVVGAPDFVNATFIAEVGTEIPPGTPILIVCARGPPTVTPPPDEPQELSVHFLDVGQGDATLLLAPDATVLIDAGRHDRSDVVPQLQALGVTSLDLVVITHGHADHIGQLASVLQAFPVAEVWMSGTPHTTQTYEQAVAALEASAALYEEPRAGDVTNVGSLLFEIVNPAQLTGGLHRDSLSMRVSFGDVSFLFTGDAEAPTEAEMIARDAGRLSADIYQVGHHGSQTSTSAGFLAAVSPAVAIYSAGAGNQFGHPHDEVIERLTGAGVEVYGTDVHGTVTVTTNGSTWAVSTQTGAAPIPGVTPTEPDPETCVDINTASLEELQQIIHIGPERAQEIIDLRPFASVDELTQVSGIGPARLADIEEQGLACVQ